MHVVPQFHSSELSEQCFFPSHHSVRWTHWWLLQESSLSLHFAVEIHTHTHRENQHWGQQLCSVVHYLVERVTCKSHSSWPHQPAGGSLGNRHRSCWLWCTRYCRDTPTESALSSLTDTHTHSFVNLSVRLHHKYIFVFSHRLTTVLLVAVVVTVQVSVTAFGRQDTATRSTLEVTGRALCHNQEQQEKLKTLFFLLLFTVKRGLGGGEWCLSVPSTPASGSRQVTFPPSSGNWLQSESSGHCSPTMPSTDSHFSLALRHSDLGAEMYEQVLGA